MLDYTLITDTRAAGDLAATIASRGPDETVALDTETTTLYHPKQSLPYSGDRCTAVSINFRGETYVLAPEVATPVVAAIAAGRAIFHNSIFDRAVLQTSFGVEFSDDLIIDTLTLAFLLDESQDKRLKDGLGAKWFGVDASIEKKDLDRLMKGRTVAELYAERRAFVGKLESAAESRAWAKKAATESRRTWSDLSVADPVFVRYAAQDAWLTHAVYDRQIAEIAGQVGGPMDITPAIRPAMDITGLCYRLGRVGMRVDVGSAQKQAEAARRELEEIERSLPDVDLNSPQQLARHLYETLGLPCTRKTKKAEAPSTDEIALRRLAWHPDVVKILRHREVAKLLSAFFEPILGYVGLDGRVHPSYACARTVTGRMSCSTPNMQQIPGDEAAGVKEIFIPADGLELIEFDLGQIEPRLTAEIAGEERMLEKFYAGIDPYIELAEILGVERKLAKRASLSAIYGVGKIKLAQMLAEGSGAEPDVAGAARILETFWRTYPAIAACMTRSAAEWQRNGYLPIPGAPGRFRRLWNSRENHPESTHKALNSRIQGAAAELLKNVLLAFEPVAAEYGIGIVGAVHDSIVCEVEPGAGEALKPRLEEITAAISPFKCPLVWEMKLWPTATKGTSAGAPAD